ncbi:MaoC/PaaZ C-terminal domain-containing protein [Tardiphaga sp. OK245]|uniref:MaoC/PaaZ C-terminal domain-containing protein n=1 Tax=Tardiphaga sp. OK245 TaxID=1855306 RepID=UPI0008A723EB|nr:MaoC/PaaZ C-terminal domain-containing protein [Tardiphaga sp. OK245]SEH88431.1 Acyl dehydratase [Tardiphaga sp. OK245]
MAIDYETLKARPFPDVIQEYGSTDCILYALGIGVGMRPNDPFDLHFTHEDGLQALPTMAVTLGYPGFWLRAPDAGLDWRTVLHVSQELIIHRPLPSSARIIGRNAIEEIYDRGPGKGALMITRRDIIVADDGQPIATIRVGEYCRGETGFGGPPAPAARRIAFPDRPPDFSVETPTSPQAALLYRLCGDDNALHALPDVANDAGFPRPILHGLASFGLAGFAIVKTFCAGDPTRLRELRLRLTAPVFPGETLRTDIWQTSERTACFRTQATSDARVVLDNGDVIVDVAQQKNEG